MKKKARRIRALAVTGATGFVGRHFARLAPEAGYEVRALTRRPGTMDEGLQWIEGALDQPEALARLVQGADAVIHIAGLISGERKSFEAVNAFGTATLIDAARKMGVRRFIHISSLAAREPDLSDYGWSKWRSERLVAASGLEWTIIRPPAVYGPGDRETLDLFRMAKRGLVALPPGGRFSIIHVEDLCRLILSLLDEPDTVSELYEPDDGRESGWDHREFAEILGGSFGRRARTFAMPRLIMRCASRLDCLFRGKKAKLTADRVRYFCHPDWVIDSNRKPPAALWRPKIPTEEGVPKVAEWYVEEGWLS